MVQYQQTLIIPKPTQRIADSRCDRRRPSGRNGKGYGNHNAGINSILAYFNRCVPEIIDGNV